jgi:hypothetical protein
VVIPAQVLARAQSGGAVCLCVRVSEMSHGKTGNHSFQMEEKCPTLNAFAIRG